MIVFTPEGRYACVQAFLNRTGPHTVRLLSGKEEPVFPGYAPQRLDGWRVDSKGATHEAVSFICTMPIAPESVTGYFVRGGDGVELWRESFPEPYKIEHSGDAVMVVPQLTLENLR